MSMGSAERQTMAVRRFRYSPDEELRKGRSVDDVVAEIVARAKVSRNGRATRAGARSTRVRDATGNRPAIKR